MKKLINVMVLLAVLTALFTVTVNVSWTGQLANGRAGYLSDDSNEPEMQATFVQLGISDDDPNEPEFASVLTATLLSSPDDDPNEPELRLLLPG